MIEVKALQMYPEFALLCHFLVQCNRLKDEGVVHREGGEAMIKRRAKHVEA